MDYGSSLQGDYSQALLNNDVQVGRIKLLNSIFEWIKLGDLKTMLFGLGYGSVTPNSWVHGEDLLFVTIGTRGAISGFGLVNQLIALVTASACQGLSFLMLKHCSFFQIANGT